MDAFLSSLFKAYFQFKSEHSEPCIRLEQGDGKNTEMEVESILAEKELIRLLVRPFTNRASEQIAFIRACRCIRFPVVAPIVRCCEVPDAFWTYCQQFNRVVFKALRNAVVMGLESLQRGETNGVIQSNLTHLISVGAHSFIHA